MTFAVKLIGACALVYALVVALFFVMQDRLLFMPDTRIYTPAQMGIEIFEDITAATADGLTLNGWHHPARPGMPTVIVFHGNASTWAWRAPGFRPLAAAGYGVLLAGYRGYGGNPGTPSEQGLYADAEAWIAALQLPPERIVLYGESLGTGIAVEMAVRHPGIKAMILEAPYTEIPDIAAYHFPVIFGLDALVRHRFASIDKIANAPMPKLFLLAGDDRVVPDRFGRTLYDAARTPKTLKFYPAATHVDIRDRGGMRDTQIFLDAL